MRLQINFARMAVASAVVLLLLAGGATASPPPETSTDSCVGLECNPPSSGSYVPEAQSPVRAVADLADLQSQNESGFYEMPPLVGEGQSRSVVYLMKAGQFDRMPESVRNLTAVQRFLTGKTDNMSLVVIDSGIWMVLPSKPVAGTARRPVAKTAQINPDCPERTFCLFDLELTWPPSINFDGPTFTGAGWINLNQNYGASMVNDRGGDSLLADGANGGGTRYCAIEWSEDLTFSNNPIGLWHASSVALLGSAINRC